MRVRDSEILLPTTMVGSYPRPPWLTGKVFGEFDEPDYIDYGTKERFWDAVQLCVDDQVRAGLDILSTASSTSSPRPCTSTARSSTSGATTWRGSSAG